MHNYRSTGLDDSPIDQGTYRLTFGKHAGRTLGEVPMHYLLWLSDSAESATLRAMAKLALDLPEEDATEPSRDLAAVVMPGVIWRWRQEMQERYADDAEALEIVAAGLRILQEYCSEFTGKSWDVNGGDA